MNCSGLLIAGTHSGCGKTTVTLGLMAALARRGLKVHPFKTGPDFIDPALHRMVTGRVSRNLDIRMCGEAFVRHTFAQHTSPDGIAVVEGVMGLFDGGEGSAATLAKTLGLPVLLVVDARSAAESVAAVVHGFNTLDPEIRLAGVICNRVGSARHQTMIADAMHTHCPVPVVGFLPRQATITLPSRHLGLCVDEDHPLSPQALDQLVSLIESHLDLGLVLRTAADCAAQPDTTWNSPPPVTDRPVQIGVARDAAFSFYYEDNLDLLRAAGAEPVFFSPLNDERPPSGITGLYLGGGYPELYAHRLSTNSNMLRQIRHFAEAGRPIYAESGGFLYLCQSITDQEGATHTLTGLYPFAAQVHSQLRRLGYRQVQVQTDCLLAPQGSELYGHEFHYSSITINDTTADTAFRLPDGRREGYRTCSDHTLAGFVHLHWGRTPAAASRFVRICQQVDAGTDAGLLLQAAAPTPQPL